jgi:DNA polymerase epsilon subunit 1
VAAGSLLVTDGTSSGEEKFEALRIANDIDERMGFARYESGPKKVGWLVNMKSVSCILGRVGGERKERMLITE